MAFVSRHIGPNSADQENLLSTLGYDSMEDLIAATLPSSILGQDLDTIPPAMTEAEYLNFISELGQKNNTAKSYIGQGYYGTHTPSVLLRNIFQNPGWYTQYTPYQAEISQGRLEALLNFQTMVSDLTGMPLANASLLDEGTAAAEAMIMCFNLKNKRSKDNVISKFFVDRYTFDHVLDVLHTRAEPLGIEIVIGDHTDFRPDEDYFGVLLQYPNALGSIEDYSDIITQCQDHKIMTTINADLLSLAILKEPGSWDVDVVVGNTQRFGVPMGYGGPHAAFFATRSKFKRSIPGRIIGLSKDRRNLPALRMALQTREQHIKREKATSNICTAQALLAIMAGMYAVYHGPKGLKNIALDIHDKTKRVYDLLQSLGVKVLNASYFDTLSIELTGDQKLRLLEESKKHNLNLYYRDNQMRLSIDESTTEINLNILTNMLVSAFGEKNNRQTENNTVGIPAFAKRTSEYLTHPVFSSYHSETSMMRYLKSLENKDLSLMHSMIPLGSCTMKLNAATQLMPVSDPNWSNIHPFTPLNQVQGYQMMIKQLEEYLSNITGFTACSLQPNSGAQGEYTGLLAIRKYHQHNKEEHRNIALIPTSAHGTNPASAVMAGMKVKLVACDEMGNIDVDDLKAKCEEYAENLAALMITYPSTHGVFEEAIQEICDKVHQHGGLVYMDGANMNAQVGLTSPGIIGADVCHLNLHKTFSIPHGGGGPGMGPICVNDKLKPFLPKHYEWKKTQESGAVSSAPWGSASILLISYAYIRLLGPQGLKKSTEVAILNANYIRHRLQDQYDVLYTGKHGNVAHELIIDLRPFKGIGISAEDIAKRLIDYGFHAPTLSFPVPGTIMIEPTESEDIRELDRFCDAMLQIRQEIDEVARGDMDPDDNVLINAPHTVQEALDDHWSHKYTREKAVYPLESLKNSHKFWPSVSRVDNAYGDRNLVCTCPDVMSYAEE